MLEILNSLTEIQDDLAGVVITVMVTAIVSILTLFINSLTKILLEHKEYNKEQQQKMKNIYPELKVRLNYLKLLFKELESISLYSNIPKMYRAHYLFTNDEAQYRRDNQNNIGCIDLFIDKTKKWVEEMAKLNDYFKNADIPLAPLNHPLLKYKVGKMIETLQYHSFLVSQYVNKKVSADVFLQEIDDIYKTKECALNNKCLQKYVELLSKWYLKY